MAVVLLTGMSGAGKSTVLSELGRRGHAVVDTDVGGWVAEGPERHWHAGRLTGLLDAHTDGHLFLAGTVAGQGAWYPRFDAVVLLTAPLEVLLDRVATRTTNDFGKDAAGRAAVVRDAMAVEPLLRRDATAVVDTRRPLPAVVAAVLAVAGPG
ncbi:AAA family ATPase [Modestobacter sp. VKM Ac-2986]|uniref:AAA family ATPase n=1 Tax=Modestobacter sp. VKM Ac-2986 TaxID=3004140 RepID=UPI0022AA4A55|nr:AAA family ATPase [Modestobacter sp. VKM Ac-2986]MCZ2828963.1 AAA family ATPase [Modestobacter sp. VKM Ac-2986]